MKYRFIVSIALAAALTAAPLSSASAHGRFHGGPLLLPFVAVGAVLTGAALIATAPIRAVNREAVYTSYPAYAPPPQVIYAAPPQPYYEAYPAYYRPAPYQYYSAPRGYYY